MLVNIIHSVKHNLVEKYAFCAYTMLFVSENCRESHKSCDQQFYFE